MSANIYFAPEENYETTVLSYIFTNSEIILELLEFCCS